MSRPPIENLELHYQPIVALETGEVFAAEALLRDARGGKVETFARDAEEDGEIFDIDRFTIGEACRAARRWQDDGLEHIAVHVNVSALELGSGRFADLLDEALERARLDASALQIEITETSAVRDTKRAAALLDRLSGRGIGVWLDDFGTGHSSLAWLKDFHVRGVKLPQSFVTGIETDTRAAMIVAAVIALAGQLSMRVIAEGVESERQIEVLRAAGCDAIQGYYLAKPVTAEKLRAAIGRRTRRR